MSEVYVGNKPVMNYALAVMAQFNGGAEEVAVKARGRAISKAVDVAEVVRRRFLPDVDVKDIQISTDRIDGETGPVNVSAIEIVLARK
ncbi:DNA-binding protein Alba [Archaeoglobus sp.]